MSAHTPGPWIACDYGDYADYDGKCTVILGEGGDIRTAVVLGFNTEENRANALLIAAAPDLLAALRLIEHATAPNPDDGGHHEAAYEIARAAIAKATGGTP